MFVDKDVLLAIAVMLFYMLNLVKSIFRKLHYLVYSILSGATIQAEAGMTICGQC